MKNIGTTIISVIAVLALMAGTRYVIGAVQTQNEVNQISNAAQSRTSEPLIPVADARAEFMSGCDDGSFYLQTEYCGCTWTQLVQAYGVNALMNDGLTLSASEMEAKYQTQVNYCLTTVYDNVEL